MLYPRLEQRGYAQKKVRENVEAEIMQVVLEDAQEQYPRAGFVVELRSEDQDELAANVETLAEYVSKVVAERAA